MKIEFKDGTSIEIKDTKIWEVYRAINIADYAMQIKENFCIKSTADDNKITDEDIQSLAERVDDWMINDDYFSEAQNEAFENALERACKEKHFYEADDCNE